MTLRTRVSGSILVLAVCFAVVSALDAQEKRPRIATSVLCGVVTDLGGRPVAKATVSAMWADFGTSQAVDASGRWSFGQGTGPHWMKVDGEGFETFVFDYIDRADPKNNGADKPAFFLSPKDKLCAKPIYVRLAPTNSTAGFVTLDPNKGIMKEKTQ